jgi:hypothetical protein
MRQENRWTVASQTAADIISELIDTGRSMGRPVLFGNAKHLFDGDPKPFHREWLGQNRRLAKSSLRRLPIAADDRDGICFDARISATGPEAASWRLLAGPTTEYPRSRMVCQQASDQEIVFGGAYIRKRSKSLSALPGLAMN